MIKQSKEYLIVSLKVHLYIYNLHVKEVPSPRELKWGEMKRPLKLSAKRSA